MENQLLKPEDQVQELGKLLDYCGEIEAYLNTEDEDSIQWLEDVKRGMKLVRFQLESREREELHRQHENQLRS